jgi:Glycoside hydrolase family 2 C-terminal domain 5
VATLQMSSDPSKDELVLTVDDASIEGDGTDATRFTFRGLDAYGNQRPYPTGDVTLTLSGPATLVADNPFPFATYGGVGGGFIKSQPGTSGAVTITAAHPTLGQASGQLTVQSAVATTGNSPPGTSPPTLRPPTAGGPTGNAPAPTASSTGPIAIEASPARVRTVLSAVLSPRGPLARIRELLRHDGYTVPFDAPSSGRLVIDWYSVPRHAHHRRRLVAAAAETLKKAGPAKVKIKLTSTGHALLKHAELERLTVDASFTPTGQPTTRMSRVINLKR